MAAVSSLISRAMRLLGQLPSGGTPTDAEYADGLVAVNGLLSSWCNEKLMAYAEDGLTLPLTAATSVYTIGPSGTLVATRPVKINIAYILDNSISYPVKLLTEAEYFAIPDKDTAGSWPTVAWYDPLMPNGALRVYPVPNATRSLKLLVRTPLTVFAAVTDTVSLPPGWEDAIAFNLAVRWAPEFETAASAEVVAAAKETKASIKRVNSTPILADTDLAGLFPSSSFNITTG